MILLLTIFAAYMIPAELRPEQASFSPDTNVLDIPFVGRAASIKKALVAVQTHANTAIYSKSNSNIDEIRVGNSCLFAVGAPGIGKTRFGEEFPQLLAKQATGNLAQKLQNVRTVRLTFKSGKNISAQDTKWEDSTDQVNWILTSRAIHAVYNINQPYKDWALELSKLLGNDLPQHFNMNKFIEELHRRDQSATTIYFHLDEVQQVKLLPPVVGADVIRTLSTLYAKYNSEKLLTLLLFTGTILSDIKSVLEKQLGVGSSVDFPLVSLLMETREETQINDIISTMKRDGKLPWLRDDWNESTSFKKLVAYLGGVPRLLELLFLAGTVTHDINNMATILSTSTEERYSINAGQPSVYNACCLALSGKQFELTDKLPNAPELTVEQLHSNGYLFLAPGGQLKVPFVYVGLTVLPGDFAKGDFEDKITAMLQKLLNPTGTLLWQDFEAFTLVYTMVRVKALLHLKYTTFTVKDYFHHAHTMSKNIEPLQFKLAKRDYVELGNRWPESGWPVSRLKGPVNVEDILGSVFLNASGASFDGFEFVELADKQEYVIFAHQNKYTADGKTVLSSKSIAEEAEKAQAAFQKWKKAVEPNDKNLMALKEATKQLILVIFTNRNVVLDPVHPMPHENIIVINNYKHFGPFQAVTKFFQVRDDEDGKNVQDGSKTNSVPSP